MIGENERRSKDLAQAIEIIEQIVNRTTCPDPEGGGCIGGLIPGYGCVHEAASCALRRLKEIQ